MTPLPTWMNRKNLGIAVLCAGGAALLLHPASLVTLGLGAYLGCRGKGWLKQHFDK